MTKPNPDFHVVVMTGTTDGTGAATVDSYERNLIGLVEAVIIDGIALDDSADLDINTVYDKMADGATERVGLDILDHGDVGNAAINELYPRDYEEDITGTDIAVATGVKTTRKFALAGCGLRVTVAAGGATKAFQVRVLVRL